MTKLWFVRGIETYIGSMSEVVVVESPEGAELQRGATPRRGVARRSRPLFLVDWPPAVAPDLAVFSSGMWWAFGAKAQWWPCTVVVADPVVC